MGVNPSQAKTNKKNVSSRFVDRNEKIVPLHRQ
jgi:hypothetical protein